MVTHSLARFFTRPLKCPVPEGKRSYIRRVCSTTALIGRKPDRPRDQIRNAEAMSDLTVAAYVTTNEDACAWVCVYPPCQSTAYLVSTQCGEGRVLMSRAGFRSGTVTGPPEVNTI